MQEEKRKRQERAQKVARSPAGMGFILFFGLILAIFAYSRIQQVNEVALLIGMTPALKDDYNGYLSFLVLGIFMVVLGFGGLVSARNSTETLNRVTLAKHFEDQNSKATVVEAPYVPPPPSNICPTCHHKLSLIKEYNAWYCFTCKEYV